MLWGMMIIFAILAVILLAGKGSFLIAGYNTASKEKKACYDEKKLCRVVGGCMGIAAVCLGIMAYYEKNMTDGIIFLTTGIIFADIIICLILCNTVCVKKDENGKALGKSMMSKKTSEEKRKAKAGMMVTVVICAAVAVFLLTGDVHIQINEQKMEIQGSYWMAKEILLEDINHVEYRETMNVGRRTNGVGSFRLREGNFQNTEFGNYILYSYTGCKTFVVMETDKGIVVVNQKTEDETKALYEKLVGRF